MMIIRKLTILALTMAIAITSLALPAAAAGDIMHGIGFVDASSLRLRSQPDTDSKTLALAPRNDCVAVISKDGDWYKVNYNLQVGYMHSDYLEVSTRENAELGYGTVTGTGVNLRSGPSTSHSRVAKATSGDKCYIIGLNSGWYKVIFKEKICYIRSDYLKLTEMPYENQASPNSPKFFRHGKSTGISPSASALNGNSSKPTGGNDSNASAPAAGASGAEILAEARKYLGTPYVYGGASPSGFDCSGFVYYVLKQCGYSPYRTPADQYRQGTSVTKANLQVGDIVFFANTYGSGISHVGIYAGNGQFIHSPNSRSTVSYSDLTSGYWANHYFGARRMG